MDKKDDFTLELIDDKQKQSASAQEKVQEHAQSASKPEPLSLSGSQSAQSVVTSASADSPLTVTLLQELVRLLQPKPFRKRHPILFWGFILCLGFLGYCAFMPDESPIGSSDRIAVVRVEGVILKTEPLLKWISKIEKTPSVKGVLLRIDSPGGGAAASQELYSALVELGKKKPIVASMGSAAASGGLMVAMAAQHIVANPSTITGSIGVRMDVLQVHKLLETLGIGQETLSTGKYKDVPSVMRALNPEERDYLQGVLQDLYEQFTTMIAASRKMPLGEVQKFADGRIFTGKEAQRLGLVDSLGGQSLALAELYKRTGISPDADLYEQPKELEAFYEELLESMVHVVLQNKENSAVFLYK